MYLPPNINDTYTAGQEWLKRKIAGEDRDLPEYPRPTKVIKEKGMNYWQKEVAQYGFITACVKFVLP